MPTALRHFKADFFKALAHPVRLHIIDLLRTGELSVNELQTQLDIEPSSVSQQLAVLRGKNIVEARKNGTSVIYRVRDPQVFELLDVARWIFNTHLIDTQSMLEELADEEPVTTKRKTLQRLISR